MFLNKSLFDLVHVTSIFWNKSKHVSEQRLKVTKMSDFTPHLSESMQGFAFFVISIVAFVSCVSFFLYENKSKRNFVLELILAITSAFSLGSSLFFALIRADVVL